MKARIYTVGGLKGMEGMKAYPINDYQYVLELCGKKLVLTYNNLKKQSRDRKMLKLVRVLMTLAGIVMFTGFMFAVGTIGHTEMLDEMHMAQDLSELEVMIRSAAGIGVAFIGAVGVRKLYEVENTLIQRLES